MWGGGIEIALSTLDCFFLQYNYFDIRCNGLEFNLSALLYCVVHFTMKIIFILSYTYLNYGLQLRGMFINIH